MSDGRIPPPDVAPPTGSVASTRRGETRPGGPARRRADEDVLTDDR
ncbi:hypothetical protein [Actinoplanes sp. NPDC026623]